MAESGTQIYLLLIRSSGNWMDAGKLSMIGLIFKTLLKDMIRGDSLDVPFVKFIRVRSVEHEIGFGGTKKNWAYDAGTQSWEHNETGTDAGSYSDAQGHESRGSFWQQSAQNRPPIYGSRLWSAASDVYDAGHTALFGNDFVQLTLPEHSEFTFTKWVDNATPQIAYGCSVQEPFPLAIFFFRRKIGLGVAGVRNPFFVIGLYKSLITKWSLQGGQTESVTLKYSNIAWCSLDPLADTNAPSGFSQRFFNVDSKEGGELGWAAALQLLSQGICAAAGAIVGATESSSVTNGPPASS